MSYAYCKYVYFYVYLLIFFSNFAGMKLFKVVFYTKGFFVKDPNLRYEGGDVFAYNEIDGDTWFLFEARDILQQMDNTFDLDSVRLWWKRDGGSFDTYLRLFSSDVDACLMSKCAEKNKCDIEIYVEQKVTEEDVSGGPIFVEQLEGKNKGKVVANGDDTDEYTDDDDDSVKGIHLDDSEEDRMADFDDGFDDGFHTSLNEEITVMTPILNENNSDAIHVVDGGTPNCIKGIKDTSPQQSQLARNLFDGQNPELPIRHLVTPELDATHVIDDDYTTDELDSADENDTDNEGRPPIVRYKEEDMCKIFKFKVGMEFSSLAQFKEAILTHNVLNGFEVKFVKNDDKRCRVQCKKKCGYVILCSRVVRSTTFKVKTILLPKHKCGRSFKSKNAKASWVSKVIEDKMKFHSKMNIAEIVSDIKTNYSVEIPAWRALRARQLAKKAVEGDAIKQYSLLWSYSAELKKAGLGNRCKLEIERHGPSLQPRFKRCYMCLDGCKNAIKNACRPFIGLDGCHLKNKYGGILLVAIGRDPNDQYLPIAFAVVESECKDSWSWFMTLLLEDIGERRWCFISDQQKVIFILIKLRLLIS